MHGRAHCPFQSTRCESTAGGFVLAKLIHALRSRQIYAEILGYRDEWLFEVWMGILLDDRIHRNYDRYDISIYPRVRVNKKFAAAFTDAFASVHRAKNGWFTSSTVRIGHSYSTMARHLIQRVTISPSRTGRQSRYCCGITASAFRCTTEATHIECPLKTITSLAHDPIVSTFHIL